MSLIHDIPQDARIVEDHFVPESKEITKILLEDQDSTVLFTDINGAKAVGNVLSTRAKIAKALNIEPKGIVDHLSDAISGPVDTVTVENPGFRSKELPLDLMKLPIPKYYPKDGGRYITAGVIVAECGDKKNISFHRMMVMDADHLAVRLVPRHLYTMYSEAKKANKTLKVSICIGTCAEVLLSAASSVDYGVDELRIASSMFMKGHGEPLKVGKCDNGITVPAECDYVLEGEITLNTTDEGPFVDITGTYDFIRKQPIIKINKMWSNADPVFQLLVPGANEHFLLMGLPREPVILKTVRQAVPRTHAVRLTEGGCCWLHGVVSISKNKKGDGVNAIMAAFTGHPSMKRVIIVDEDIDIFDDRQVEWAMATRFQAKRMVVIEGAAGSSLDPSADGVTSKIGYDATIPIGQDPALYGKVVL
jgi:2,5-furandicarboxylate decarboxylase 1